MSGIRLLEALSGQDYDDIKREYLKLYAKTGFARSLSAELPARNKPFDFRPAVRPEWKKPLSPDASAYLAQRMVDRAPFLKEPLYSCPGKAGEYILIPWTVNGVEAYWQLNDYKKLGPLKYVFPKNEKKLVYGLDNVDPSWPYVIVFEGVYDSLFVKNAVAVGTKSITRDQSELIAMRWPNHKLVVSFDNDGPGAAAMQKMIETGRAQAFFRWYGAGTEQKDVNEAVLASGDPLLFSDPAKLEKMIFNSLQMKMWLVQNGKWTEKTGKRGASAAPRAGSLDFSRAQKLFE